MTCSNTSKMEELNKQDEADSTAEQTEMKCTITKHKCRWGNWSNQHVQTQQCKRYRNRRNTSEIEELNRQHAADSTAKCFAQTHRRVKHASWSAKTTLELAHASKLHMENNERTRHTTCQTYWTTESPHEINAWRAHKCKPTAKPVTNTKTNNDDHNR